MKSVLRPYSSDLDRVVAERGAKACPYRPTYAFPDDAINEWHAAWLNAPLKPNSPAIVHSIDGALRRQDAGKLYELAYFSEGPVSELGTSRGLSAYIIAQGKSDGGDRSPIDSVDLNSRTSDEARRNMKRVNTHTVVFHIAEGAEWVREQSDHGRQFGFAFIDHSHRYDHVFDVCRSLKEVMLPGAFVAFHDFVDVRNFDPANDDYGVFQAATEGLPACFEFYGAFGCTGVFRKLLE